MKTYRINYLIKGMLTTLPLYRYIKAENIIQAKDIFKHEKAENEIFCAIEETTTELPKTERHEWQNGPTD